MRPSRQFATLNDMSLFVFKFLFGFTERYLFLGQQFFKFVPLRRIGDGFEHFSIMLNVLPMDKAFHTLASVVSLLRVPLALDQSGFIPQCFHSPSNARMETNRNGSGGY